MTSPHHEHHAAILHACTRDTSHPDSEEAVRIEQHRTARELESFARRGSSSRAASKSRDHDDFPRSRHASNRPSIASSVAPLEDCESLESYASTQHETVIPRSQASSLREQRWYGPVVRFWTTHISLTIDDGAHRDHLALERTFLGYLRTSLILVMTGVITAQLFRIQRAPHPDPTIGFYVIGEPLSAAFIGTAIFVIFVGAMRFWRLQRALVRGKALAGGWELLLVMGISALLLVATFALVLAVNIDKAM